MNVDFKQLGLDEFINNDLYNQYLLILNQYIKALPIESYQAVLLGGSFAKGELSFSSDIDLIVIDESCKNHSEKSEYFQGIEFSLYFFNQSELSFLLSKEKQSFNRRISNFVYHSKVICSDIDLKDIFSLASLIYNSEVPLLSKEVKCEIISDLENFRSLAKHYFNNYDDFAFYYRFSFSITKLISFYFKLIRKPIPNWKSTKNSIIHLEFLNFLTNFFEVNSAKAKFESYLLILSFLEELAINYKLD